MKKYSYLFLATVLFSQPYLVNGEGIVTSGSEDFPQQVTQGDMAESTMGEEAGVASQNGSRDELSSWMPDKSLQLHVMSALGVSSVEEVTKEALAKPIYLEMDFYAELGAGKIQSLEGLQFATNAEEINVADHQISDLTPLAHLPALKNIGFRNNVVQDLTPLAPILGQVEALRFAGNQISDISMLEPAMSHLKYLNLEGNQVSDISVLQHMKGMRHLNLAGNRLTDITAIATGLQQMVADDGQVGVDVYLTGNHITDFSPLAAARDLAIEQGGSSSIGIFADYQTVQSTIDLRKGEPLPQIVGFYPNVPLNGSHFTTNQDQVQVADDLASYPTTGIDEQVTEVDLVFSQSLLDDVPGMVAGQHEFPDEWFNPLGFDGKAGEYEEYGLGRCSGYSVRHRVTINWLSDEPETSETQETEGSSEGTEMTEGTGSQEVTESSEGDGTPQDTTVSEEVSTEQKNSVTAEAEVLPVTGETVARGMLVCGGVISLGALLIFWWRKKQATMEDEA